MNRTTDIIKSVFLPALALLMAALAGCGGGSSSPAIVPPPPAEFGALKKVSTPDEFEARLKSGLTALRAPAEGALASSADGGAGAGAGAASGNFTGTYTQERNVDEFDAVRYDGSQLYIAPRRFLQCCFFAATDGEDDGAANTGTPAEASIRILSTNPADGTASLESRIPLEDGVSVQGMYLGDDRMFALTSTQDYGGYGDFWTGIALWAPEKLGYRVYDVVDPAAPALEVDVRIDGVFVDSRRVGDVVYIVSRYTPIVENLAYNITTAAEQAQNEDLLTGVSLDELLPRVTINGAERPLIDPTDCYIATDDEIGYPVITSITAVPIGDPTALQTTCYNEEAYGAYVTEQSIYFTQFRNGVLAGDSETRIHKFALAAGAVTYRGSADVVGLVWRGGQADFRMSEYNGDLRLLASSYAFGTDDFIDHKLYVLRESASRAELEILAELPNAERPQEIGKPNEALYGVRFLGDRAYAVTFEQIDPLYVIDLADPSDPLIAGELTVTGFSDFLHPVTEDLLLGLGSAAEGGVKLELFDVSVISQPLSRGSTVLGGAGSFSEARYDRHAFTYQADINGIDRMAIPATVYSDTPEGGRYDASLHLFEIHDKTMPSMASLLAVGTVAPATNNGAYVFKDRNRSFIHDDTVYFVHGEDVWAANWFAPTAVNGPF